MSALALFTNRVAKRVAASSQTAKPHSGKRILTPEEDVWFRLAWTNPAISRDDIGERIGLTKPTVCKMAARMRLGEKASPPKAEPKRYVYSPEQLERYREKRLATTAERQAARTPSYCIAPETCERRGKDNRCDKCERRRATSRRAFEKWRLGKAGKGAQNPTP